jgi:SAM-dependent methyltransferase
MSAKDALFRMSKTMRAALERAGIEFQLVPIPKRVAVVGKKSFGSPLIDSSVDWLRVPMYDSIYSTLSKDLGREFFKEKVAVEIGGSEGTIARMLESFGATIQVAPDYPRIDVEDLPYQQESCDIIILDQIFEHLRHPWRATEQIRRVLKKNGLCICTSVFVYPIHHGGNYGDYYRFSPEGFRAIFEGFKIISSDGWGNAEVLRLIYNHSDRGPEGTSPITKPEAERLGIYNYTDAMNYMMTWCIAQNQAADPAEVVASQQ